MEENQFKSVKDYVAHLEENGGQPELEVLKEILSRPSTGGQRRGQLAGLTLENMTDEQLKRELINSKSVLYKAQQRNADPATIEKNQARVDAALAEKAKRTPEVPAATDEVYTEGETNDAVEGEL